MGSPPPVTNASSKFMHKFPEIPERLNNYFSKIFSMSARLFLGALTFKQVVTAHPPGPKW